MSILGKIHCEELVINILWYNVSFYQRSGNTGRPSERPLGGLWKIAFETRKNDPFLEYMVNETMIPYLKIVSRRATLDRKSRIIEIRDVYVLVYRCDFNGVDNQPMTTYIELSPASMVQNGQTMFVKKWKITDPNAKKVKATKIEKEEQKLLVTAVTGPKELNLNQKGTYKVTSFNRTATKQDEQLVKWIIKVDNEVIKLRQQGKEIHYTPKDKNLSGKEIVIMPYLVKHTEDVSVETLIKEGLIDVTTSSGKYLFSLKPNNTYNAQTITAKKLYSKGLQWFCPQADNYLELIKKDDNLPNFKELKHFTWKKIVNFSEIERWNINYRSGGSGDWKLSEKGADGYILVTVNKFPYWADAIGQIPFSIDLFTDNLEDGYSKEEAIKETLSIGQRFGDGKIFGGKSDFSNEYDNHIILRACLWATKRYDVKITSIMMKYTIRKTYSAIKTSFNEDNLSFFLTKEQAKKYFK